MEVNMVKSVACDDVDDDGISIKFLCGGDDMMFFPLSPSFSLFLYVKESAKQLFHSSSQSS